MQIAPDLIGKSLEKFPRQPETESARHVLGLFRRRNPFKRKLIQAPPDEARTPAKIDHATSQTFIHRHVGLAREWVARIESESVTPQPLLRPERFEKSLSEAEAAILHGMMRIDFQIAFATEVQIQHAVSGQQSQHVIQERNPCLDGRFPGTI